MQVLLNDQPLAEYFFDQVGTDTVKTFAVIFDPVVALQPLSDASMEILTGVLIFNRLYKDKECNASTSV